MTVKHYVETKDGVVEKELTRGKAIRLKCLECSAWQPKEVRICTIPTCALFPYRMGTERGALEQDSLNGALEQV